MRESQSWLFQEKLKEARAEAAEAAEGCLSFIVGDRGGGL